MCGKNTTGCFQGTLDEGSPPRVREEQSNAKRENDDKRITPACAGRTHTLRLKIASSQDHPRVCGKNTYAHCIKEFATGSPPRVREEPYGDNFRNTFFRITPACAGRTYYEGDDTSRCEDHPRVCGKNLRFIFSVNV